MARNYLKLWGHQSFSIFLSQAVQAFDIANFNAAHVLLTLELSFGTAVCGILGPFTVFKYLDVLEISEGKIKRTRCCGLYSSIYRLDQIEKIEKKTTQNNQFILIISFSDGRKIKVDSWGGRNFAEFQRYIEHLPGKA